jgi:hypothetical protein
VEGRDYAEHEFRPELIVMSVRPATLLTNVVFPEPVTPMTAMSLSVCSVMLILLSFQPVIGSDELFN